MKHCIKTKYHPLLSLRPSKNETSAITHQITILIFFTGGSHFRHIIGRCRLVAQTRTPVQMSSEPLHLLSGETLTPALLSANRTAVLYVWGDWCHICAYTSPTVSRLAEDGIPVVGIALHSGADEHIRTYMSEKHLDFPTVNDNDGRLARKWKVSVTPSIILIKNGKMVHFTSGISTYWGLRARIFISDLFY